MLWQLVGVMNYSYLLMAFSDNASGNSDWLFILIQSSSVLV